MKYWVLDARLVGGSGNHYTAHFWRYHEIDFHERSVYGAAFPADAV